MLRLVNIKKEYVSGDTKVHALKGINIDFRENEFVSILGQSGCGKTTTLNIIGGLDHYTSGDLIINGKSTNSLTKTLSGFTKKMTSYHTYHGLPVLLYI